jgi:hypothetical protein
VSAPAAFDANLDVERQWAGAPPLPASVLARIAGLATLARALAPEHIDEVALRAPGPVDLGAVPACAELPALRPWSRDDDDDPTAWGARGAAARDGVGDSWRARAWTARAPVELARAVSDRRWALDRARELGPSEPAPTAVTTVDELRAAVACLDGAWVAKAVLTAAGRDRCGAPGPRLSDELAVRAGRLLATFGALVVEPWHDRLDDVGVCGVVASAYAVELLPPHRCRSGERGQFVGIDLEPPPLAPAHAAAITGAATLVGERLAAAGFRGPFSIDAYTHRDRGGEIAVRALVEVNPRYSFGHVAHALGERLGVRHLDVGRAAPAGARAVAPGAWVY